MFVLYPRGLLLEQHGDIKKWRRQYRSVKYYGKHYFESHVRMSATEMTQSEKIRLLKRLLVAVSNENFQCPNLRSYIREMESIRKEIETAQAHCMFCGQEMLSIRV